VSVQEKGMPQGGPLSPLLSNIVLDDLDRELERRGHSFCRYADDCNIYVGSRRSGERVMASITRFVEQGLMKLGLSEKRAARSAFNQKGPWFNAGASHMNQALPKRYFDQFGLISLLQMLRNFGPVLT